MKTETSKATTATKPTTADVQESLFNAANFKDFLLRNEQNMLAQTLPEYLALQLKQKHLKRADVVRGSHLDRTYVYQIFSGKKAPSRDKLLAIAFGLQLSDEETQKMLKLSGNLELYVRDKRDAAILFAIQQTTCWISLVFCPWVFQMNRVLGVLSSLPVDNLRHFISPLGFHLFS